MCSQHISTHSTHNQGFNTGPKFFRAMDEMLGHAKFSPDPAALKTLLHNLSNKHCYVIIRNYLNMDFHSLEIPTITQYFVPKLEVFELDAVFKREEVVWVPSRVPFHSNTVHESDNVTKHCNRRYYIDEQHHWYPSILISRCLSINLGTWSSVGRPGNCRIIIDYFMPRFLLEWFVEYPSSVFSISSWEPTVHQIIVLIPLFSPNLHGRDKKLYFWMKRSTFPSQKLPSVGMVLFFIVKFRARVEVAFELTLFEIYTPTLVDYDWARMEWSDWEALDKVDVKGFKDIFAISRRKWNFEGNQISQLLRKCEILSWLLRVRITRTDRSLIMDFAFAHLIQLLLGNFSYEHDNGRFCVSPGVISNDYSSFDRFTKGIAHETYYDIQGNLSQVPLIWHNNTQRHVRFIVCGDRGRHPYNFENVTKVFDSATWLCLLVVSVVSVLIITGLHGKCNDYRIQSSVIQVFKVFIEQSSPFPSSIESVPRFRPFLGTLTLVSVVICNAYKNFNVYDMTQPRKPAYYETVKQLMSDGFKLYSRVGSVQFDAGWANDDEGNIVELVTYWETPFFLQRLNSSKRGFHMIHRNQSVFVQYSLEVSEYDLSGTGNDRDIHEPSSRAPEVSGYSNIERILSLSYVNVTSQSFPEQKISSILSQLYHAWEKQNVLSSLRKCEKAAVFLPADDAAMYKKILRKENTVKRLDISSQILRRPPFGINFRGFISRSMRQRVLTIQEAGLSKKWENQFNLEIDQQMALQRDEVSAAQLYGNILVIFVLFMMCMVLTCNVFSSELLFYTCMSINN